MARVAEGGESMKNPATCAYCEADSTKPEFRTFDAVHHTMLPLCCLECAQWWGLGGGFWMRSAGVAAFLSLLGVPNASH